LITGGTGSLGKALINRLLEYGSNIVVYSRDEGKQALFFRQKQVPVECVIGDVRDFRHLDKTMRIHKPDFVIHTAALKRVDDLEFFPEEAVKTNIEGSKNVAVASLNHDVTKCILISTDKACQPVNVYGSTKFIAERIFTNLDYDSEDTLFCSVRYGNVIASRGSFIPHWMETISQGDGINVTSMDMTRFLFTLNDAVDTVLKALELSEGGEVFVPKISSFKMSVIIDAIKKITGVREIQSNIIGVRPGEKLHEDMLAKTELDFTYSTDGGRLLSVTPQYTRRKHSYSHKYNGLEFNSSLHNNDDVDFLCSLINRGLSES
jgi:UDP-glucose 4-epimerase